MAGEDADAEHRMNEYLKTAIPPEKLREQQAISPGDVVEFLQEHDIKERKVGKCYFCCLDVFMVQGRLCSK